jgi:hypothetical protein
VGEVVANGDRCEPNAALNRTISLVSTATAGVVNPPCNFRHGAQWHREISWHLPILSNRGRYSIGQYMVPSMGNHLWTPTFHFRHIRGTEWHLYMVRRKKFRTPTLAAERQVRDFLIGPRNKKQRKKRSTIKILHPPFQITSRDF